FQAEDGIRDRTVTGVQTCALPILPGFFAIPPVDRDEARFAQATKQMLETGDYVDIRFQDEVRYKKPVGIYWLQAAVVKTAASFGDRKSTRLNSSHRTISYAVFCLK